MLQLGVVPDEFTETLWHETRVVSDISLSFLRFKQLFDRPVTCHFLLLVEIAFQIVISWVQQVIPRDIQHPEWPILTDNLEKTFETHSSQPVPADVKFEESSRYVDKLW